MNTWLCVCTELASCLITFWHRWYCSFSSDMSGMLQYFRALPALDNSVFFALRYKF